jgi:predicted transcriptional regulator
MSSPRTISFRIPADKITELDTLAKAMDRDRSYLLNEAVENYLNEQRRIVALIETGLEASQQGNLIDDDDVAVMVDSWAQKSSTQKAKTTA